MGESRQQKVHFFPSSLRTIPTTFSNRTNSEIIMTTPWRKDVKVNHPVHVLCRENITSKWITTTGACFHDGRYRFQSQKCRENSNERLFLAVYKRIKDAQECKLCQEYSTHQERDVEHRREEGKAPMDGDPGYK